MNVNSYNLCPDPEKKKNTYKSLARQDLKQCQELHPIFDVLKQVIYLQWWFMLEERRRF